MITNKTIVGKDTVLYLNSSITLDANTYDTVIFSGNSATLTLPKTIDSINGQKLKIQNNSNSCLTINTQGLDLINDNGPVLQIFLYLNETVTLIVDVDNMDWIVTDKTEVPLISLPENYAVKAVSTWTNRVSGLGSQRALSVCWSPELKLFCAVNQSTSQSVITTSSNGINWTVQTISNPTPPVTDNSGIREVVWASRINKFIAIRTATNLFRIVTSPDGINWTNVATPASAELTYSGLVWANDVKALGTGLAIGIDSATTPVGSLIISSDAVTWTTIAPFDTLPWKEGCWSPELQLFVVVGNNSTNGAMTSPDGTNWTLQTTPVGFENVCWAAKLGLFVAVNTAGQIITSPNAITWTVVSNLSPLAFYNIAWSQELGIFVVVGNDTSSGTGGNFIVTSFDGVNWIKRTIAGIANNRTWNGICWSPDLGVFCAVSGGAVGGSDCIVTSSFKARPPTSYNTFGVNLNTVSNASIWNFNMFGRGVPVTIAAATATITEGQNWIIVNFAGTCTLTLPTAATSNAGMELTIKTVQNQLVNSSVAITQFNGTSSTAILAATTGKWATLVSNGTSWVIMHAN